MSETFRFDGDAFGEGRTGLQPSAGVEALMRSRVRGADTLCARVATFFESRPGEWIDGRELATVAGCYGWRTRVSEIRKPPYGLDIRNRQRKEGRYTVSEYRLVIPGDAEQ